ncbi:MAG: phosphopantothenoylcysteine decarboxylase [Phycisphaerales bacterium]
MKSPRLLMTAGPTHEPIDSVRFIGNRSSGRMGVALAEAAVARGWSVTLLLGPGTCESSDPAIDVVRFRTCADLQSLLQAHAPKADVLIMAAAVADYRPKPNPAMSGGKFRRTNAPLILELEPTPDLLAGISGTRRPDQLFVGFALEPREELLESAQRKLVKKKVDMVVGNPLATMDSDTVEAMVLYKDGRRADTPRLMTKRTFAPWLLDLVANELTRMSPTTEPNAPFALATTAR